MNDSLSTMNSQKILISLGQVLENSRPRPDSQLNNIAQVLHLNINSDVPAEYIFNNSVNSVTIEPDAPMYFTLNDTAKNDTAVNPSWLLKRGQIITIDGFKIQKISFIAPKDTTGDVHVQIMAFRKAV